MLVSWLHLLALTIYLGALLGLWIFVLSPLGAVQSHNERLLFLTQSLKIYNPLQIGALGVLLMTGAFQLTDLKRAYGAHFTSAVGATLAVKLGLAFVVIILSTYQCMGLAHRFVRQVDQQEPVSEDKLNSTIRRLKGSSGVIIVLALVTAFFALRM